MGDLSPHFNTEEFTCKCGCGHSKVSGELVTGLEILRELAGLAIVIDRGYSCPQHNAQVGGKPDSQHLEGTAADIRIPPLSVEQMYRLSLKVPQFAAGGIGIYDGGFLHVDVRATIARWARVRGKYMSIEQSSLLKNAVV